MSAKWKPVGTATVYKKEEGNGCLKAIGWIVLIVVVGLIIIGAITGD